MDDPLRDDDLRTARETPPAVKLVQALEMMAAGLRLKRAQLERDHPEASAEERETLYLTWLMGDD